jgi:hypothetical protein
VQVGMILARMPVADAAANPGRSSDRENDEGKDNAEQRAKARAGYEAEISASKERDGGKATAAWQSIHAWYGSSLDHIKRAVLAKDLNKQLSPRCTAPHCALTTPVHQQPDSLTEME